MDNDALLTHTDSYPSRWDADSQDDSLPNDEETTNAVGTWVYFHTAYTQTANPAHDCA
jgi:hypothetical protein